MDSIASQTEEQIDPTAPTIEWDERGLMKGVEYRYRKDNSVDWQAMIDPEFLAIKKEHEAEIKAKQKVDDLASIDKTKVHPSQLLVLLGGWKRLLFLRGYTSLVQHVDSVTSEKAVCTCTITFAPNYETRGLPVTYSWTASASYINTSGDIPQMFLESTAANRAFVLCLRGFLNINLVGKDEIGPARFVRPNQSAPASAAQVEDALSSAPQGGFQGKDTLAKRCHELGISFEKVKEGAATKYRTELKSDPTAWTSFDDVPSLDAYTLLDKLSKAQEAAKKKG